MVPIQSPRPTPQFFHPPTFSQRKKTPLRQPPKAPAKTCPPVSRVFTNQRQWTEGPCLISFTSNSRTESLTSPHYISGSQESYFEQCFEILSKLGEGSFGEVFKVRSKDDGKYYAIKRSRQRFKGKWDRRHKLDEVEKHERLPPHVNCVRFYRAWEERQHLYIQTELCLMSLSEYADIYGKIPENRLWSIILDLSQGLKHLHDNRLCHLDIKPANIFIGLDSFTCKLGDFGLVVSMDNGFREATEGDACYIADEILKGRFSSAADIFSLGISLLELACDLELPSGGESWHMLRRGCLPRRFTEGLSSSLVELLSQMMHPDPECRPSVNYILKHSRVRRARLIRPVLKTKITISPVIKSVCDTVSSWFMSFVTMLLSLLYLSPWKQTRHETESPPRNMFKPASLDDSLSDSDAELEIIRQSFQSHNNSWISHSPLPQSSHIHKRSPIPFELGDSSDDESTLIRGSPTLINTSSPIICYNNERSLRRSSDKRRSRITNYKKTVIIEPRNLMDVFRESHN